MAKADEIFETHVEYRLARNAVVEDARHGRVSMLDVCDAHPELLRAARNIGKSREELCPICKKVTTVQVTYVFGEGLPAGGTCPTTLRDLNRLKKRELPVICFDIEVCPECAWHYLTRKYGAGGTGAQRKQIRARA